MNSEDKANKASEEESNQDTSNEETQKIDIDQILEEFKRERAAETAEEISPEAPEQEHGSELESEPPEEEQAPKQEETPAEGADERDEEYEKYYQKYYKRGSAFDVIWRDRPKRTKVFFILLIILILLITAVAFYIDGKLDLIDFDKRGDVEETSSLDDQMIYDDEDYQMMNAIQNASSLKDYLYKWANNGGELMSSKNVINVLLLGLDSEDGLENGGRSDVIMLLSLNKKTKKINISSVYRDTWLYMNVDDEDRYTKFNASYFYGGADGTIKTFEQNLKVKIDFYVAVDFSSFTDIINTLGGITLEVQEYEAKYINRTSVHNIEYGPAVKLDGWEALVFARIRHSDADSDVSRTRRQRAVITALINELRTASLSQMNDAATALFKYVKTDLTRTQIVGYSAQALANRWMDYEIGQTVLSDSDVFGTGYVGDAAAVFMDMPLAANRLQTGIFGESNIVLDANRVTIFDVTSSTASASSSSYTSYQSDTTQATQSYEPESSETTTQTTTEVKTTHEQEEPSETTTQSTTAPPTTTEPSPETTTEPTTEATTVATVTTTQQASEPESSVDETQPEEQ